jgi:hypothetical protein
VLQNNEEERKKERKKEKAREFQHKDLTNNGIA